MTKVLGKIALAFYEERYKDQICHYELDDSQKQFTTLPSDALSICEKDMSCFPIVMLHHEMPVGFFILQVGEEIQHYTNQENAMLIRSVSVNPAYQGMGFAQHAMGTLPEFVSSTFPDIKELFLIVNLKNTRAEHVYLKTGYLDRGIRRHDPSGIKKILHYVLNDK